VKEEGFLGSTLLGGKRKRDENSRSEETSRSEAANWKCTTCTLINTADNVNCAACATAKNESKKRSRSESGFESESEDEERLLKRQRVNSSLENNNNGNNNHSEDENKEKDRVKTNSESAFHSIGSLLRKPIDSAREFFESFGASDKPSEKSTPQIRIISPSNGKLANNGEEKLIDEQEFILEAPSSGKKN